MLLGSHVPSADPLGEAAARRAQVVQVFLSAPRAWRPPAPRADAEVLRAAGTPIYVHAPYLINVAAGDDRVRSTSVESLALTCAAAATIGAAGVVVHGGHLPVDEPFATGVNAWRTTLSAIDSEDPVLIENTAGGRNALAHHPAAIAQLWDGLAGLDVPFGFCLDTCHLHAATDDDLIAGFDQVLDAVGRIDLVHLNDSRDVAGSGRDRHANLGGGEIDPAAMVEVVRRADAPVVVETPGGAAAQRADLDWLRHRLAPDTGSSTP